jgi:hypothetical protein
LGGIGHNQAARHSLCLDMDAKYVKSLYKTACFKYCFRI